MKESEEPIKCYSRLEFIIFSLPFVCTLYSTDTPEEYWCQVPELFGSENFTTTAAQRKFLSIPLIEVSPLKL